MIDKIIGFIGAGNMGSAMIGGIIHSELVTTSQIIASAHSAATLEKLQSTYSIETTLSNETVAERSDILFLAVKPNKFDEVIPQISSHVKSGCVIVSIAAGKTIAAIEDSFGKPVKLVRAMPNTPALVGEAMSALCVNQNVTPEELKEVQALFNSFGKSEVISESLMDAVIGVSGSSPAYVYMFIEAMADAAVADGMPRAQAYKFAPVCLWLRENGFGNRKAPGRIKGRRLLPCRNNHRGCCCTGSRRFPQHCDFCPARLLTEIARYEQ